MRLIHSSDPGAVERDRAVQLLADRAILTRMVCRELLDCDIEATDRRPQAALFLLLRWIAEHQPQSGSGEPHASHALEHMIVPEGHEDLFNEIKSGADVCEALFMLFTADNSHQVEHDHTRIKRCLANYWDRHAVPVPMIRTFS